MAVYQRLLSMAPDSTSLVADHSYLHAQSVNGIGNRAVSTCAAFIPLDVNVPDTGITSVSRSQLVQLGPNARHVPIRIFHLYNAPILWRNLIPLSLARTLLPYSSRVAIRSQQGPYLGRSSLTENMSGLLSSKRRRPRSSPRLMIPILTILWTFPIHPRSCQPGYRRCGSPMSLTLAFHSSPQPVPALLMQAPLVRVANLV